MVHREKREIRYLEIINYYDEQSRGLLAEAFAHLVAEMDDSFVENPKDVLGELFHELELHNKWTGQFFTPEHICELMGNLFGHDVSISEKGYTTVLEPACGSGAMILGFARSMKKEGLNFQKQLVVTAVDVDLKCVMMTYIQLSLYGIPAVVIHGNTLTVEEWSRWYTPSYIADDWLFRERCGIADAPSVDDEKMKRVTNPLYGIIKSAEMVVDDGQRIAVVEKMEVEPKKEQEQERFNIEYFEKKNGQLALF